eukprot:gene3391-biopygen6699
MWCILSRCREYTASCHKLWIMFFLCCISVHLVASCDIASAPPSLSRTTCCIFCTLSCARTHPVECRRALFSMPLLLFILCHEVESRAEHAQHHVTSCDKLYVPSSRCPSVAVASSCRRHLLEAALATHRSMYFASRWSIATRRRAPMAMGSVRRAHYSRHMCGCVMQTYLPSCCTHQVTQYVAPQCNSDWYNIPEDATTCYKLLQVAVRVQTTCDQLLQDDTCTVHATCGKILQYVHNVCCTDGARRPRTVWQCLWPQHITSCDKMFDNARCNACNLLQHAARCGVVCGAVGNDTGNKLQLVASCGRSIAEFNILQLPCMQLASTCHKMWCGTMWQLVTICGAVCIPCPQLVTRCGAISIITGNALPLVASCGRSIAKMNILQLPCMQLATPCQTCGVVYITQTQHVTTCHKMCQDVECASHAHNLSQHAVPLASTQGTRCNLLYHVGGASQNCTFDKLLEECKTYVVTSCYKMYNNLGHNWLQPLAFCGAPKCTCSQHATRCNMLSCKNGTFQFGVPPPPGNPDRGRNGRGPDAGHTIGFKETDADRARAWPFLPSDRPPLLPFPPPRFGWFEEGGGRPTGGRHAPAPSHPSSAQRAPQSTPFPSVGETAEDASRTRPFTICRVGCVRGASAAVFSWVPPRAGVQPCAGGGGGRRRCWAPGEPTGRSKKIPHVCKSGYAYWTTRLLGNKQNLWSALDPKTPPWGPRTGAGPLGPAEVRAHPSGARARHGTTGGGGRTRHSPGGRQRTPRPPQPPGEEHGWWCLHMRGKCGPECGAAGAAPDKKAHRVPPDPLEAGDPLTPPCLDCYLHRTPDANVAGMSTFFQLVWLVAQPPCVSFKLKALRPLPTSTSRTVQQG